MTIFSLHNSRLNELTALDRPTKIFIFPEVFTVSRRNDGLGYSLFDMENTEWSLSTMEETTQYGWTDFEVKPPRKESIVEEQRPVERQHFLPFLNVDSMIPFEDEMDVDFQPQFQLLSSHSLKRSRTKSPSPTAQDMAKRARMDKSDDVEPPAGPGPTASGGGSRTSDHDADDHPDPTFSLPPTASGGGGKGRTSDHEPDDHLDPPSPNASEGGGKISDHEPYDYLDQPSPLSILTESETEDAEKPKLEGYRRSARIPGRSRPLAASISGRNGTPTGATVPLAKAPVPQNKGPGTATKVKVAPNDMQFIMTVQSLSISFIAR
jgi:hypothetical protein